MLDASTFNPGQPYKVTAPDGKTLIVIKHTSDQLPVTFALMATRARNKVAIRLSGGCKGMSPENKVDMLEYFAAAFRGFEGMIWSGGTRQVNSEGLIDPMVTDVPGVIAAQNPLCIALGSCPRTDVLNLQGDSQLVLDGYGTRPNPGISGLLIVQNGPDGKLNWDGDLGDVFGLMENLLTHGGFYRAGVIAWNGGPITRDEIIRSAKRGWPTIIVRGSGRVCDELADLIESGDEKLNTEVGGNRIHVVRKENPRSLRAALLGHGFILGEMDEFDE